MSNRRKQARPRFIKCQMESEMLEDEVTNEANSTRDVTASASKEANSTGKYQSQQEGSGCNEGSIHSSVCSTPDSKDSNAATSDEEGLQCRICDRAFSQLDDMRQHEKEHADILQYVCQVCNKRFQHKRNYSRHVKLHAGTKSYQCTKCDMAFVKTDQFKLHLSSHISTEPFNCTICSNQAFPTAAHLIDHLNDRHPSTTLSQEEKFGNNIQKCFLCSATLTSITELNVHLKSHMDSLMTGCSESENSENVTKLNKYKCLHCNLSFAQKDDLEGHVRLKHGEDCLCICPTCSKNCGNLEAVYVHYKKHHGKNAKNKDCKSNMLLTCHICQRMFFNKEKYDVHVKKCESSLAGIGIYVCPYCNSRYQSEFNLYEHIEIAHTRDTVSCKYCTMRFINKESLKRHIAAEHRPHTKGHEMHKMGKTQPQLQIMTTSPEHSSHRNNVRSSTNTPPANWLHCSPCGRVFNSATDLSNHNQSKHQTSPSQTVLGSSLKMNSISLPSPSPSDVVIKNFFLCNQCDAALVDFPAFRDHQKTHLEEGTNKFNCPHCEQQFPTEEQMDNHVLTHYLASTTEYGCQSCLKLFLKPDELQKHLMDIHAHHLYKCSLCDEMFDSKVTIQVHFAVKHSNECKLYKCTSCRCLFRSEMEWQLHVKVTHLRKAKPYRCLFCQEAFSSEMDLQCHITTHQKHFVCCYCEEAFHVEFLLDKHIQERHGTLEKSSSTPGAERVSLQTKSGPEKLTTQQAKCNICDISFNSPVKLQEHRKKAHSIQSSKTFSSLTVTPVTSMETLSTNTQKCNICDKVVQSMSELAEHKLQHCKVLNGETCVLCKASVTCEEMFYKHSRIHSNDTATLQCIICRQTLSTMMELQAHGTFHYENKMESNFLPCSVCMEPCEQQVDIEQLGAAEKGPTVICKKCSYVRENEQCSKKQYSKSSSTTVSPVHKPRCQECSVKFETMDELNTHKTAHNKNMYQCIKCQQSFFTEDEIKQHVMTHVVTEGTQHECRLCLQTFDSPRRLQCHLIDHTYAGCSSYLCPVCSEAFPTAASIQAHVVRHAQAPKPYQCPKCTHSFFFRSEVENHILEHNYQQAQPANLTESVTQFFQQRAQENNKVLSTTTQLKARLTPKSDVLFPGQSEKSDFMTADNEKQKNKLPITNQENDIKQENMDVDDFENNAKNQFECRDCAKVFANENSLDNHMKIHRISYTTFKCSQCSEVFEESSEMQQHYFTKHSVSELQDMKKQFSCPECGKDFPCLSNLQGHMKIHTHGTLFKCPVCSKEFALARNLTIHLRMHSGEKPYECPVCKKRFARKENRKTHMKSHTGQKPFVCPHCGKMFARKCHVKGHIQSHFHSKESSCVCEKCYLQFKDIAMLQTHLANAHNIKFETECQICNEKFTLKKNLQRHLREIHGTENNTSSSGDVNDLMCTICNRIFITNRGLLSHIQQKHRTNIASEETEKNSPLKYSGSEVSSELDEPTSIAGTSNGSDCPEIQDSDSSDGENTTDDTNDVDNEHSENERDTRSSFSGGIHHAA